MASYLEKTELKDEYDGAQEYAEQFFVNFDEYERLADNRLPEDLPDELPPVNDGTLSGLLLEIAMRQLRQLQTGKVRSELAPKWMTELVGVYWTRWIIPNATTQSSFFNKFFNGIKGSQTHGSDWFYSFFTVRDGYSGADFSKPYVRDVILEKGKVSDRESNKIYLNQYFTKGQVKATIQMAKKEDELAKHEKRESNNSWNVARLETLVRSHEGGEKDTKKKNPTERQQSIPGNFLKIIRMFQRGYGAPFYYYSPDMDEDEACVGETTNKNPTGEMPITGIYCLEDLQNPYGKGLVELGGHVQNILDSLVRDHVLATSMGIRPPIKVGGKSDDVNFESLVWDADAIWETGKEAKVDAVDMGNSVYSQFVTNYGLYKTLLMNLLGISDMTVSSESGSPQYSKTPQGVEFQQERTTIHDNFRAQNTDTAFSRLASNLINITIANRQGSQIVPLLEDEIERLNRAGWKDDNGEDLDRNDVEIVWDIMRGDEQNPYVFDFDVDANSSQSDDTKSVDEQIVEILKIHAENPGIDVSLQRSGYRLDTGELWKQYLMDKVRNWEKVVVPIAPGEAAGQGAADPMALQEIMQQYGLDEQSALFFLQLRDQGMTDEQIIQYLQQGATA